MADTSVTKFFGDKERKLHLTTPLIGELERICGSGINAIATRLFTQQNSNNELAEIIRLGLVGGGCDPAEAKALVSAYLTDAPIMPTYMLACHIMNAAFFGATETQEAA